jgi:hypothetical protein
MIDVRVNGYSIKSLLSGPPRTSDSISGVCRTLQLDLQNVIGLEAYLGQNVELWYGSQRWFVGPLLGRDVNHTGGLSYSISDPLFYLKKNPDDYFFKNMTATQIVAHVTKNTGVKAGSVANTKAVLPALYYQGAEGDKVLIDALARTHQANGKRYWFRYNPYVGTEGLELFEQTVPPLIWAFQRGVNLESASFSESVEETITAVKLVNRETGKVVQKAHTSYVMRFGKMTHFEEVDKDQAAKMDSRAQQLLDEKAVIKTSMKITGVNPGSMGQFFSGEVIYVEERNTKLLGAYHITSVTQTFEHGGIVRLDFDLAKAAHIPPIQYQDATKDPAANRADKEGAGIQQNYSAEVQEVMRQYGIMDAVETEANAVKEAETAKAQVRVEAAQKEGGRGGSSKW